MVRNFPIWRIAVLGLAIFAFNLIATYWHLFFLIWWLDIPVHILSGMWVALLFLALYYHADHIGRKEHSVFFVVVFALCSALVIGLLWEVYEFVIERSMDSGDVRLDDTLKDLCDDLIGGAIAAWLFVRYGYNKHA
jgi:hypothetical protein